jgi:flagellar motor switch protein FliN/FliY
VSLGVTVELGRCSMRVGDVLKLGKGSVVELDRAAGEPVDVLINRRLVARGEVVAVDDRFGVRLTELLARKTPRP